jgi:hypothetical protein
MCIYNNRPPPFHTPNSTLKPQSLTYIIHHQLNLFSTNTNNTTSFTTIQPTGSTTHLIGTYTNLAR